MGKLSATGIKALKQPGRYQDGDGLMLNVSPAGTASWLLRIQVAGRRREFGLGSLKKVGLAEARSEAAAIRKQMAAGLDPVAERKRKKAARTIPTFKAAAERVHRERQRSWKNGKHQAQWLATLETHAYPALGALPVDAIDGPMIREVLLPIWLEIPETARRVRQRIGAVLDWAYANGFRKAEAPMRSIGKGLPRQPRKDGHHAAMPYAAVPAFLASLRGAEDTMGRLALQATILTATRSGETRGATWEEIDFEAATWTIPAKRMKAGRVHIVPLSASAVEVFRRAEALRSVRSNLVFPGADPRRPLSDMTLLKVLRDLDLPYTVHGFRSSFRDWAAEETTVPAEIAEAALAHAVPDRVVAAYRRTDFLKKRRALMSAWAGYLNGAPADVIPFPVRKGRA